VPQYTIDLTQYTATAPLVFRGSILSVTAILQKDNRVQAFARFQVDRWYRGKQPPDLYLRFVPYHPISAANGHDCNDFKPGSHWLVFAVERSGSLELVDDCQGATAISPRLGPDVTPPDLIAQMEADFIAGLDDTNPMARVLSIQRLGGLKSAASRPVLHHVIETGSPAEVKWAVYAALRTGDVSVLAKLKEVLDRSDGEALDGFIALELRDLKDRSAIPGLIGILGSATNPATLEYVLTVLGEKLKSVEALPGIAAPLAASHPRIRFSALVGMEAITHEPACTLPLQWTESMIEPQAQQCLAWWDHYGREQFRERRLGPPASASPQ
jgi:hypothetical protein